MALVVADRVQETSTTSGTGALTLAGAVNGFRSFSSAIGNGNTTYYAISDGTNWEIGLGTYTSSGNTLSRDTVLSSSNSNALVSFSSATKNVWVDYPAGKSVYSDGSNAIQLGRQSANYFQTLGSAANITPELSVLGSDTNIPFTIETKGTGAINLSAGSRGVNVQNGQTVTAITRTAAGGSYTSAPIVAISAPTTAGGVQATASAFLSALNVPTITSGGTGYSVNDVLTFVGGSGTAYQVLVTAVSGGVITAVSAQATSLYTTPPSNPISVTGGTGTGATFTVPSWAVTSTFTITNAGSGYVEQPTVTFSGGGGSGAAAYATVGVTAILKGLGSASAAAAAQSINFVTPAGTQATLLDVGDGTRPLALNGGSAGSVSAAGIFATVGSLQLSSNNSPISFFTAGRAAQEQFRVSHTASAVNYVQVTGAATGGSPSISAQGSDTNAGLVVQSKGASPLYLTTVGAIDVRIQPNNLRSLSIQSVGSAVNYGLWTNAAASGSPSLAVAGTDTDIDLTLTPKGAGRVRFGTYTATVSTITGYIEIKDSGGTTRRLAVVS